MVTIFNALLKLIQATGNGRLKIDHYIIQM